jgi:hypothetical protein
MTIVDTIVGNRNGRIDPGETFRVVIATSNPGDFMCQSAYGKLSSTSPYLTLLTDSVYLNNIEPRTLKNVVFTVVADAETPIGTGADMTYTAHSGLYTVQRTFRQMIGLVAEDWETNTFTRFPWQASGTKPWTLTEVSPWEGVFCAKSGSINDYQTSQMFLTYNSVTDDSISFYLRTSSEQDYDFLMFSIDGVLQGQWSGETPWTRAAFPVSAGQHTFKWLYLKDLAYGLGQDAVWVDLIAFPPPVLPSVDPGPDVTVCAGLNVHLQGTAQQYDSIRWTTTGDGGFGNDTALSTTYTPGTNDLLNAGTTLRLTGFSAYGSYGKNKVILIHPRPIAVISVFPGDTACAGQTIQLSADSTGHPAWLWTPGNFTSREVSYDTTITGMGTHMITLVATNLQLCENRDSVYLTFKNCTGSDELALIYQRIYPNPGNGIFFLEIKTPEPGPLQVSVTNVNNTVVFADEDLYVKSFRSKKLDLTFLSDGIYLLIIKTVQGTSTHKLIIRK